MKIYPQLNKRISRLIIGGLWVFLVTSAVSAHGVELLRSEPPDGAVLDKVPTQVKAWFNEELQTGESSIMVVNSDSSQVDHGDGGVDLDDPEHASMVVSLSGLSAGAYIVRWHAVLLDGDATDGEFGFTVGAVTTNAPASQPAGDFSPSLYIWLVAGLAVLTMAGIWIMRGRSAR